VLKATGSSWEKVVKVNVYLKSMDDFAAMNEVYEKVLSLAVVYSGHANFTFRQLLPNPKPARTCIQAGKLPNDVDVEMEAIATT
jgi:enamine deaminase RidA (YjgF/YER057c/UK114 family)